MAKYLQAKLGRLASINPDDFPVVDALGEREVREKKAKAMLQAEAISLFIEKDLTGRLLRMSLVFLTIKLGVGLQD